MIVEEVVISHYLTLIDTFAMQVNITTKLTQANVTDCVDYSESVGLLPPDSHLDWHLKFACPANWKWSEGAPNKWKIISTGTCPA